MISGILWFLGRSDQPPQKYDTPVPIPPPLRRVSQNTSSYQSILARTGIGFVLHGVEDRRQYGPQIALESLRFIFGVMDES